MLDRDKDFFMTQLADYERYLEDLREDEDKGKKKFNLNTENLNMLSFKPSANNNIIEKKEEDNNLDIVKLNKYFKSSQKGQDVRDLNISYQDVNELMNNNNESASAQLVKNEILNSYFLDDNFKLKKEKLDKVLSIYDLPKLEDYEGRDI